MIVLAFDIAYR